MTFPTEWQADGFRKQLGIAGAVVAQTTHGYWVVTSPSILEQPPKTCSICGQEFREYPNNPQPITSGICCSYCDDHVVTPARIAEMKGAL